jgi:DNA-binding MarR family transcriptional regulator
MKHEINHIIAGVDRLGERRDGYRMRLRRHGMTPPLLLVLRVLESHPGMTMVDLASRLSVSIPTMQSRMARLDELGLISRTRSAHDRRKVPAHLSPRGRALLRRVPLAGAGRLLDALEKGETTTRQLRRLAVELERLERLLFPEERASRSGRRQAIWRR